MQTVPNSLQQRLQLFGDSAHGEHGINWKRNQMLTRAIEGAQTYRLRCQNTLTYGVTDLISGGVSSGIVTENAPTAHPSHIHPHK